MSIYDELEDKDIIKKVNKIFYDKVYSHPWLKLFFKDIDQDFITEQQTQFIVGAMGGPRLYSGRLPSNAHPHMFITEEIFNIRKKLLEESFKEINAPNILTEKWLKIDESFRSVICKETHKECQKRYNTDKILIYENPEKKYIISEP